MRQSAEDLRKLFGSELTCSSDLYIMGDGEGERVGTMWRMIMTLVTVTVVSAWCSTHKIKNLLLFFSHWFSGFLYQVSQVISGTMVYVCWIRKEHIPVIWILKFIEQTATNMLALTNLAICVNLALIVSAHHTMTRVKSVSSPWLILAFLFISIGLTLALMPFWHYWVVSRTLFWPISGDAGELAWVLAGYYILEFLAGIAMVIIVAFLLVFRMPELRQCWRLHRRIQFYFGLTAIAVIVNVSMAICGIIFIVTDNRLHILNSVTWSLRHLHIALDTLVLYGVLGASSWNMDERANAGSADEVIISGTKVPKRYRTGVRSANRSSTKRSGGSSSSVENSSAADVSSLRTPA